MDQHKREVERIAIEVQAFYNSKEKFRIYHGSTNSARRPVDPDSNVIDTSRLSNVINIDVLRKIAVVEANVPMDALLEATLKLDLMPFVVTEFPGITVGGAYAGTAGESSTFKHHYFDRTVSKIEMVLGNGEVVECSNDENEDIFRGVPGALGTLGVVTLLHVRLQPAVRFVEVTYHPFASIDEAVNQFRQFAKDPKVEYLEGIMFSAKKGAVITGRFRHDASRCHPVVRFSRAKDPWYFMHVEARISEDCKTPRSDLIPLPDYIFRYNRGCFWTGKSIFDTTGIAFNRTTRRVLDFMLRTRMLYKALHAQNPGTLMLVQDLALSMQGAIDFVKWETERFGIWPLWLCPLRGSPTPTLQPHILNETKQPEMMLNVGLYGHSPTSPQNYDQWISANQELEDKVTSLNGMKWAYAAQLYTEEKFWQQYDREYYDNLRERCYAMALPDIYEKTKVEYEEAKEIIDEDQKRWSRSVVPVVGNFQMAAYCLWAAFKSRAWRLERHRAWKDWAME